MKQISTALAGLLCMAASSASFAQKKVDTIPVRDADKADAVNMPSLLSYTFAELGYTLAKYDTAIGDIDADGFGLSGSFLLPRDMLSMLPGLASSLYVTAGYAMSETDEINSTSIELTDYRLGLGYRLPLSQAFDVNAELDFVRTEQERSFVDPTYEDADSGFRIGALGRYSIIPQVEVNGGVRYVDDGEDTQTVVELGGLYHVGRGFAAVLNTSVYDDVTTYGLGARYNFGF